MYPRKQIYLLNAFLLCGILFCRVAAADSLTTKLMSTDEIVSQSALLELDAVDTMRKQIIADELLAFVKSSDSRKQLKAMVILAHLGPSARTAEEDRKSVV